MSRRTTPPRPWLNRDTEPTITEYLDRSRPGWKDDRALHDVTIRCPHRQCLRETLRVDLHDERFHCSVCGARGTGSVELCSLDHNITSVQAAMQLGCYIEPADLEVWR